MSLSLCLRAGGGDGGSIPGRFDLVDIKRSIMSGNDKSHYKAFEHNSMGWGGAEKFDDSELKIAVAENCAITQVTLKETGVQVCRFGYLYNKESLIGAMLNKTLEPQFQHIRGLKETSEATLTPNPEYSDAPNSSEVLDSNRDCHYICPVTQLPMNGKYKFVLIKTSKVVLSERGLKEAASKNEDGDKVCPMTNVAFTDDDVVLLHQHLHDPEKLAEEHKEAMRNLEATDKKRKKKKSKRKDKEEEEDGEEASVKRVKADPTVTIKEKSKSAVYASLFRKGKNEKVSAEDLLMKAPGGLNGVQKPL